MIHISTREIMFLIALVGLAIGGVSGYYLGYDSGWEKAVLEQKTTVEENPFADVQTNPLEDIETNPLENIKTNPFE